MYAYLKTTVLDYGVDGNWRNYVNESELISQLAYLFRYKQVYLQIQEMIDGSTPFWINGSELFSQPYTQTDTLTTWFATSTYTSWTHVTALPTEQISYIEYHDAQFLEYQIGFDSQATFTDPEYVNRPPEDIIWPDTKLKYLPDLVMLHPRWVTDIASIYSTTMVSVNGLFHQTMLSSDDNEELIYIKNGGYTSTISNYFRIGMLNFKGLGPLFTSPLSALTITPAGSNYYGIIQISNFPFSLANQQVVLSLGGYLIPMTPNVLTISGETVFLDITKVGMEAKIVESSAYIDLSTLGLNDIPLDPSSNDIAYLHQDSVIQAWLALTQSFIVVVNKKNTRSYTTPFRRFNDNRKMKMDYIPIDYLTASTGRLVNYWNQREKLDPNGCQGNFVYFRDFMQGMNTSATTSVLFGRLCFVFPKLVPQQYDLLNQFNSLGFDNNPT